MNPPSALFGAMNKERKPFTYTPGGLDLSEIKSERMAQRLMRNAMNEGVPEMQIQNIQSPPPQFNASAIPNFNCLPVQVFPTFPLPANPKSLLRSRSNPDPPKEFPTNNAQEPSLFKSVNKPSTDQWKNNNNNINKPCLFNLINNGGPSSSNDNKTLSNNLSSLQTANYGSDGHSEITLPEKSYDAEYFVLEPEGNLKPVENEAIIIEECNTPSTTDDYVDTLTGIDKNSEVLTSLHTQDRTTDDFEQKKVKTVKKQSKTSENEVKQNGDTEAAVIVKLPSKKSSAKTETKVEILKKTLPDGSIEEVKKTITKTTIDGRTETKTETETTIIPKELDDDTVEIEEQEEEEEEEQETEEVVVDDEKENEQNEKEVEKSIKSSENKAQKDQSTEGSKETKVKENGHIINGEEKVEICTTKNVIVLQSKDKESDEEVEVEREDGDVEVEQVIVLKKVENEESEKAKDEHIHDKQEIVEENDAEEIEEDEVVEEEIVEDEQETQTVEVKKDFPEPEDEEEVDLEEVEAEEEQNEEVEEVEEQEQDKEQDIEQVIKQQEHKEQEATTIHFEEKETPDEEAEEEYEEAEDVPVKSDIKEKPTEETDDSNKETVIKTETEKSESTSKSSEKASIVTESPKDDTTTDKQQVDEQERVVKIKFQPEPRVSFREASIPLEKVEDVEIKPIGPAQEIIKKCHTEIITTTKDEPTGALSTQTAYNRIENIVTVNRTTKTLDSPYDPEPIVPSVKPYYVPPNDRILSTPQPTSRTYQPVYTPEPQTERRHSLLLDRLSVERQIPVQQPDIYNNNYQYNNQSYEQNQWLQEPQSEVLTVSNVKPSTISKNQQWYQQSNREENYTSNIVTPTPIMPSQLSQPQPQYQAQLQYQAQPQYQTKSQYQPQPQYQQQPQYQPQPQAQPQLKAKAQPQYQNYPQPQYTPKPEYQSSYTDHSQQSSFKSSTTNFQQHTYPSYAPKPSWVSSTFDSKPTPAPQYSEYSTLKKETNDTYQKTTQPFTSSYIPPPWEQDSSYVAENQSFYQPPNTTFTPSSTNQSWKPKPPASKFSKPAPTAYIPPAPNQSFVKPVSSTDSQTMPGRKTYYSEYERRYISVPESTYIPSETKFQAQPDPSPQYYFDNNEPSETVEPQWRKELREFTEKTSQTTTSQTEKVSVRPPWEEDPKYATGYQNTSTVTPTFTQTLRPRSWRERSYEPENMRSKEWPKANTLGRGRPHSSYVRNNVETVRERTRGVSVDRYNPSSYQPPQTSAHPPVQSHTLTPNAHPKAYHNPRVPSYHTQTSAEPREQTAPYIQRSWGESKAPPVQSRSFKYLQWITGTED